MCRIISGTALGLVGPDVLRLPREHRHRCDPRLHLVADGQSGRIAFADVQQSVEKRYLAGVADRPPSRPGQGRGCSRCRPRGDRAAGKRRSAPCRPSGPRGLQHRIIGDRLQEIDQPQHLLEGRSRHAGLARDRCKVSAKARPSEALEGLVSDRPGQDHAPAGRRPPLPRRSAKGISGVPRRQRPDRF